MNRGYVLGSAVILGSVLQLGSRLRKSKQTLDIDLPWGSVALKIKLFEAPEQELRTALKPPWPRWMRQLYEMEGVQDPEVEPESGEVTASAALGALATRLSHRLKLLAWIAGELQNHGWEIEQSGNFLIAHTIASREFADEALENAGVAGPLLAVTEADSNGWPRLYQRWELV